MLLAESDLVIRLYIAGETISFDLVRFFITFVSILYEAMPFIVLGALIAGLLEEFLPQRLITRVLPTNRPAAISLGALLGLVFPMCECGIVPVMRRLLRKGLPLSCCTSYLLAGPIINPIVLVSTFYAFAGMENTLNEGGGGYSGQMGGWWMLGLRALGGFTIAVGTSLIVEWMYRRHGNSLLTPLAQTTDQTDDGPKDPATEAAIDRWLRVLLVAIIAGGVFLAGGIYVLNFGQGVLDQNPELADALGSYGLTLIGWSLVALGVGIPVAYFAAFDRAGLLKDEQEKKKTALQRLNNVTETSLHDFVDITVFLILGALISAFVKELLPNDRVSALSGSFPMLSILLMMALAVILCLCSEADAFVAASFQTMRPAAKLSFLVLGPMLDFKLLAMYTRVFRPRLILTIAIAVIVQVLIYSLVVHYFWETFAVPKFNPPNP